MLGEPGGGASNALRATLGLMLDVAPDDDVLPADGGVAAKPRYDKTGPVPLEQNPWWATAIQILNTMLGSGILAFPYTLARVGWVTFSSYAMFFGCVVYAGSVMLIKAGRKRHIMNFSDLTKDLLGSSVAKVLQVCIVLSNAGSLLSYLNVIGSLGSSALKRWTGHADIGISTYPGFMVMMAVLVLPLNLLRSYGDLTYVSLLSLTLVSAIVLFVLAEGSAEGDGTFQTAPAWPTTNLASTETLGTFAFAASVQSVSVVTAVTGEPCPPARVTFVGLLL